MTALSLSYRRAEVRAFWILATTVLLLVSAAVALVLGARVPWLWGASVPLMAMLPGLFWPRWFEAAVTFWNKVVRRVSRIVRAYVLTVCYYTVFAALGWNESSAAPTLPLSGQTWWTPRAAGVIRPEGVSHSLKQTIRWYDGVVESARPRGNAWVLLLLPLIFLLIVLRDEEYAEALSSSTYTLY